MYSRLYYIQYAINDKGYADNGDYDSNGFPIDQDRNGTKSIQLPQPTTCIGP